MRPITMSAMQGSSVSGSAPAWLRVARLAAGAYLLGMGVGSIPGNITPTLRWVAAAVAVLLFASYLPSLLRRLRTSRTSAPTPTSVPSGDEPLVSVTEEAPGSYVVEVPEDLEAKLAEEFDTLDERIAGIAGVDEVIWEDREVFLVRSSLDATTLARRVADLLRGS